ncbi:MAG TPA: sensor histidine kinase [Sphingomicrobium sp.]|nr:sensor histidine kinase [Sphingomicrobium sp.]
MKRILHSRLPERFAGTAPRWFVEVLVALLVAGAATLLRMLLLPLASDRAPFALVFVAVIGATVLAGWRSGLLALVLAQLLTWQFVIDPARYALEPAAYIGGFAIATVAQAIGLVIVALYQREVDRAAASQQSQLDLLDRAIREIDHRTANNYQTMLSLVLAQARGAREASVREALQQVADRITAISTVSSKMSVRSGSPEEVEVDEHLRELCEQIEQGLFRPGVRMECEFENVCLASDRAVALSILVNELVTNALKHAFPDDRQGVVKVSLKRAGQGLELTVADDGVGIANGGRGKGSRLGNRLIDMFTNQLAGKHEVESRNGGTRHRIHFPAEA